MQITPVRSAQMGRAQCRVILGDTIGGLEVSFLPSDWVGGNAPSLAGEAEGVVVSVVRHRSVALLSVFLRAPCSQERSRLEKNKCEKRICTCSLYAREFLHAFPGNVHLYVWFH